MWAKRYTSQKSIRQVLLLAFVFFVLGSHQLFAQPDKTYTSFQDAFAHPKEVYKLTVRKAGLSQIPPGISILTNLRELVLEKNTLTSIPAEIGLLVNLEILDLDQNRLTSLPKEIGKLIHLKELDLDQNQIVQLPAEIGQLKALVSLDIHQNKIKTFPAEIAGLSHLQELLGSFNPIDSLPSSFGQLDALRKLDLHNCGLKILPAAILDMEQLQFLNLSNNHLSVLPAQAGKLDSLSELSLLNNLLTRLPESWTKSTQLKSINLGGNKLTAFPTIQHPETLINLELQKNALTVLPKELGEFSELESLNLEETNLTVLPVSIGQLKKLQHLDVSDNKLALIPAEIAFCKKLSYLNISGNRLTQLPDATKDLADLRNLYFYKNKITVFPLAVLNLPALSVLYIDSVLMKTLPAKILASPLRAIHCYSAKRNTVDEIQLDNIFLRIIDGSALSPAEKQEIRKKTLLNEITDEISSFKSHTNNKDFFKSLLGKVATTEDLVRMTDDSISYLKYFAFDLLDQRQYAGLYDIILRHLDDKDYIYDSEGRYSLYMGDLFLNARHISARQRTQLDSIVFFTDNHLKSLDPLINRLPVQEKYHHRLRELAIDNENALMKLAQYHDPADIEVITQSILKDPGARVNAIEFFPHPGFKPLLDTLRLNPKYTYVNVAPAVAVYQDVFAQQYLESLLQYNGKKDWLHSPDFIFRAIKIHYHPQYNKAYLAAWEKELHLADSTDMARLYSFDPEKTVELAKRTLRDHQNNYSINLEDLSEFLALHDLNGLKKIIGENLDNSNPRDWTSHYSFFIAQAYKFSDTTIARILLENLRHLKGYQSERDLMVKAILQCKDAAVISELIDLLYNQRHLYIWETERIKTILKEQKQLDELAEKAKKRPPVLPGQWWSVNTKKPSPFIQLILEDKHVFFMYCTTRWFRGKYFVEANGQIRFDTLNMQTDFINDNMVYMYEGDSGHFIGVPQPAISAVITPRYRNPNFREQDSIHSIKDWHTLDLLTATKTFSFKDSLMVLTGDTSFTFKLYTNWYSDWASLLPKPKSYEYPLENYPRKKLKTIPTAIAGKPLSWYLQRKDIDAYSKQYIQGRLAIYENDTLAIRMLDSLNTTNPNTAAFYLHVANSIITQARSFSFYAEVRQKLREVCTIYFQEDPCRFFRLMKYGAYSANRLEWQKYFQDRIWDNDTWNLEKEVIRFSLFQHCPAYIKDWDALEKWIFEYVNPDIPPESGRG